jgi:uncharacterized damage-inducible protein DinB
MRRSVLFVAAAIVCASASRVAVAQGVPNRESAAEIRKQFLADLDTLQSKFLALSEAFPADKYAWRPAPGVRSVGEAFMHVASEYYVYTPMAYGGTRSAVVQQGQAGMQKFEEMSSKAEVQQHLKAGFAYMKEQLSGIDEAQLAGTRKLFGGDHTIIETSFVMSGDLHEHLGQLIGYARMNGVKPPWSK